MSYIQKANLGDIKLLLGLLNAFTEDLGSVAFNDKTDKRMMIVWRNLRNIGFVTQSQYQQEMVIKRPEFDEDEGVYQLESGESSSEEEAPRSKARRVISKASKSKKKRRQ